MICFSLCTLNTIKAQEFLNGDLSGTITGLSSLPTDWTNVPYGDPNCLATQASFATPDLTSYTQPFASLGIAGNPYSGATFISGLFTTSIQGLWQEGIMQIVSGFIPGNTYSINFHQAVVKQFNDLDSSGSWALYIDSLLAGITVPTFSAAPYNSTSFIWESETISFIANSTSHLIKFLPMDDDSLWGYNDGLRMGIDCIYIFDDCDSVVNVGINNYQECNSILIYPNPIVDKLFIETGNKMQYEIFLFDITSRIISQLKFTGSASINTEQLIKGIYLYEVREKSGVIKTGKLVKN